METPYAPAGRGRMAYPDAEYLPKTRTRPREKSRLFRSLPAHAPAFTLSNGWACTISPQADSQNTALKLPGALERRQASCAERTTDKRRDVGSEKHATSFCFRSRDVV